MNSEFKEEFERRRAERRRQKSNTWTNLIIRIIALIFVIMIIRYFGTVRPNRLKEKLLQFQADSTQTLKLPQ